jgi:glycosyltransferase involved in cell wall biosynthesis
MMPDDHANRGRIELLIVSSDTFPPTRVDVAVLFGQELARRGHRFDWILQSTSACTAGYATAWGGGTAWVGRTDLGSSLLHRLRKHWYSIAHDLSLFRLLRTGNYDGLQVKDKFVSAVFGLLAARWNRRPFIYWLSYPFPEDYLYRARDQRERYRHLYWIRGSLFALLLYKCLLPRATHVFVQSEQMKRNIVLRGIPADRLTAVPMGVELASPDASAGARRRVLPDEVPCAVYLGSLARSRRIDFLLRVLQLVHARLPAVRLYRVGSGNERADEQFLLAEVERLGLTATVTLTGQLPRDRAMRLVGEADVCVSALVPSPVFDCASPTKLVEYMMMGKPVVANDQPEQRELIEASGGGLCVPYQEQAFAEAILRVLGDPNAARAMGERGRRHVAATRNYAAIADRVESQLLAALARLPAPRQAAR